MTFLRKTLVAGWVALALGVPGVPGVPEAWAFVDDFDDNTTGPEWSTVIDDVTRLTLAEQNQRLEVLANHPISGHTDALYLSSGPAGFLLSTAADFEIRIDFFIDPAAIAPTSAGPGSALGLVFGIGRDLPDGMDSAAVGVGLLHHPLFGVILGATVGYRVNDAETLIPLAMPPLTSGTMTIAYTQAGDALTLNSGNFGLSLLSLVRNTWNADEVYVSFGARGSGYGIASGQAFFDHFHVVAGAILPIPEPASLALLALAGPLALRRRGR